MIKSKIRKFAITAIASTGVIFAGSAHSAYVVGGSLTYKSLHLTALITKVTGKDLKDGSFLSAEIKIMAADAACSNPQTKVINPGVGPQGIVSGKSSNLTDADLVKADKTFGNTYKTTADVFDLVDPATRLSPPAGTCKTVPGQGDWVPLFWQDKNCNTYNDIVAGRPTCYADFASAAYNGDTVTLTYATGPNAGTQAAVCAVSLASTCDFTYVYLPTALKFAAVVVDGTTGGLSNTIYGSCRFPLNPANGEPYSITNPPADGWAAAPTAYECVAITAEQYAL